MAPALSPAAPAYIPNRSAPRIPPPPAPALMTYFCMPPLPPEFSPWPPLLAPPPPLPLPCWSVPQAPACVGPAGPPFHGGVGVLPHGATPMPTAVSPPAPSARPRCRRPKDPTTRMRRAATAAASCGAKAARDAKEAAAAAANQPSPRSVLAAAPSPPVSPTTSLPTSFPYQLVLPAPPVNAGVAAATAPSRTEASVAARPPHRRRPRGPRRVRAASRVQVRVRRAVKPRRLFDHSSERTSLMIRNIPNDFTRTRLMNILDEHCFIENEKIAPGGVRSEYDFLYLPIDFRTLANKGYAFVNVTSPEAARRLWVHLHAHPWGMGSAKICAVDYADLEGHNELVKHFSGSRFECRTEEYLPVRFYPPRDGTRPAAGAILVVGTLERPRACDGK